MERSDFFRLADAISSDPATRVAPHIRQYLYDDNILIDCHCHLFNEKIVPKALMNLRMPYTMEIASKVVRFLHRLNKRSNDDWGSRNAYFIEMFNKPVEAIATQLLSYYPEGTILVPLMMDMHLRASAEKRESASYYIEAQAKELKLLLDKGFNIMPFFPIDPTFIDEKSGDDVYDLFIKAFTGHYGFIPSGIKIYPTLGYLPGHPKLMEIYSVCEEKNIPVTAHCSRGVVHGYKNRVKNIPGYKIGPDGNPTEDPETRYFINGNAYARYFNNPVNWEKVLEVFPGLRLNLGHFGGEEQWEMYMKGKNNTWVSRIIDFMSRYENVYSDISFTDSYPALYPIIRDRLERSDLVRSRMLYGYDYYMVVVRGHYRSIRTDFETAMGPEIIRSIGKENPRRFLL